MAAAAETEKKQSNGVAPPKLAKLSSAAAAANTVSDSKKPPSGSADQSGTLAKTPLLKSNLPNDAAATKASNVTTSTPVVSKNSKSSTDPVSHSQVEQQLAEMMEMDGDSEESSDITKDSEQHSNASNASIGDLNDLNDESMADEMDVSDVSSSIAENENDSKTQSPRKKPRKRQPPIMIGYKKRRKVQSKKLDDESKTESELGSPSRESVEDKSTTDESKKLVEQSGSSDDNASETSSTKSTAARSVSMVDKYCWICHKDGFNSHKCVACPRVYHQRCLVQQVDDPNNFHCPECSAILKADNVNTRSPVMQSVNLDQLCTLLKHVTDILKVQKDAHHFFGPVDTREFPHYGEYVVYPMDITTLEKNIKNKVYGCTEAFLADMKWIVHNSVVFNTKTAKITNVAKNLLKTCKREVLEIETCAECYYNLLVSKETWFIEVCKRPHLLIWARLKGYPPWPAKALKCKDELVDCRFFGAHDKAWVPLKDCYLYSKVPPQIVKIKPGSNLDEGMQEIEKHIAKLKDKYGKFVYADFRIPYQPAEEMKQLREMLPNFNPNLPTSATKAITPATDRSKTVVAKSLFDESTTSTTPTTPASNNAKSKPKGAIEYTSPKTEPLSEDPATLKTKATTPTVANNPVCEPVTKAPVVEDSNASVSSESQASSTSEESSSEEVSSASATTVEEVKPTEPKVTTTSNGCDKARESTDTEAEESDSSRSTTKSATSASSSDTSKNSEASVKKVVSVKKIETINATAARIERKITTPVPIAPKPMPGLVPTTPVTTILNSNVVSSTGQLTRKITDTRMETIRCMRSVDDKNKPKSVITVKNFASFEKCEIGKSPPSQAPPLAPISSRKEPIKVARPSTEHNFSLDNVKEEPIEIDPSPANEDPIFVKEIPPPPRVPTSKPIQVKNTTEAVHRKRSLAEDNDATNDTGKKSKNDSGAGCRTVNITENVTLSLINNQAAGVVDNVPAAVPTKTQPVLKAKPPVKTFVVAPSVQSSDTQTQPVTHVAPLPNTISKPIRIAPAPGPASITTPIRMFTTTAQQQRIVNGNATLNGATVQPPRSNILLVQSSKQPPAKPTFGQNGSGEIIVQFMSELLNNNRVAMENALDKIAGKGDLRAKVILLQKEIENMRKSHEVMVEEIKRDYEVQIAELRAASLAQKKYDLAHERLKFEKEKELAVKEAKSKQWCSNCQKSANYYCCWNTAYCDFECQKEHWNQHMHVCKNDVKRKAAAECSENEPPRIMMQNEVLNDYQSIMNGYEKMNQNTSYTYQNSNSVAPSSRSNGGMKIQTKSAANKANQRPLLPRVTATVTCSPSVMSCSPGVTATQLDNSYPNVSSSVTPSSRSSTIGSVYVHPLIRQAQQQFHK